MRINATIISAWLLGAAIAGAQERTPVDFGREALSSQPRVVKHVTPSYTPAAKAARIQGWVTVSAVVRENGSVGDVRILATRLWQYLGPAAKTMGPVVFLSADEVARLGLDKQAITAVKQWVFEPGIKDGEPVAVRLVIELTFALGT